MKILLINKYFYRRAGAEKYFFDLARLLESHGHEVAFFAMHHKDNEESKWSKYFVKEMDLTERRGFVMDFETASDFVYSTEAKENLSRLLKEFKPDIVHLHNIYHQLSTSILDVLKEIDAPKVMTLHDYKLICPNYSLFTEGRVCERCFRHKYYQAIIHKCVQNSYSASALAAYEMYIVRARHIYENVVDCFVSPSLFLEDKIRDWDVEIKRIEHVPNFLFLEDYAPNYALGNYYLYFGRLAEEKGLADLVNVFGELGKINLRIAGTGPLEESLKETVKIQNLNNIEFVGFQSGEALNELVAGARAVIVPTLVYDNYPYSVLESQALGKAVVASRMGGIPEMIENNTTGYLYEPRNKFDLRARVEETMRENGELKEIGHAARERVERENSAEVHYEKIMSIYNSLI